MNRLLLLPQKWWNRLLNAIEFKRKHVQCADTVRIRGHLRLFGDGTIRIGKGVRINSCLMANPIGGMDYTMIATKAPGVLTIGDHVGISNCAIVCQNAVTIEDGVLIGGSVKIYDTDFHSLDHTVRGKGAKVDIPTTKPVHIKKNAFIGAHSIILKGVTIGERAIIGAGSVVTKDIGDDEIWGGNPAKCIRKNGTC